MATDNDQNNKAGEAKPSSTGGQAKVGDGGRLPRVRRLRRLPKPRIGKKKRLVLCALVVVVVLGGGYWLAKDEFHVSEKVYAQAAGHKIYKKDVDQLRGTVQGLTDHQVATVLANKYLYQSMAKKAKITVTDQEVEAQFSDVKPNKPNTYVWQSSVNSTYASQLMAYNTGLYKGKVLVAYFNRYVAFQSSLLSERQALVPLIGNQAAIDADRKYADNFITKLYNQLKDHKITFDQAMQAQKKDPMLGSNVYSPQSGSFDTSNPYLGGTTLVGPPTVQSELASMKTGQISEPFVVSVRNSWSDSSVMAPAYYLMVQLDHSKSSHSGLTWDNYLAQQKKHYDYKVNV